MKRASQAEELRFKFSRTVEKGNAETNKIWRKFQRPWALPARKRPFFLSNDTFFDITAKINTFLS
ncbi:MAG: hypothetical protein ACLUJ0_16130, partial [Ruthenibacterium lactatiformans]|uniref:hypothetical protein n=1 Tax=Ruthenibacterium lactatiformans TaxID=1550024 RepID=UPI003996A8A0